MNFKPIIWVEGIIGAGKTTLVQQLVRWLNLRALLEPVSGNPYLTRFYEDPARWAFPMQIELLHRRYAMQKLAAYEATIEGSHSGAILDRGLPGDRVFAALHLKNQNMTEIEWQTYERCYSIMTCSLTPPSLLLFLDCKPEVAAARIAKRARTVESTIPIEYLQQLHQGYIGLISEIEKGEHAWSRGIRVMSIDWNKDNEPIDDLVAYLRTEFSL